MIFDIFVIIITLLLVTKGIRKGLVIMFFGFTKYLIAVFFAPYFIELFGPFLSSKINFLENKVYMFIFCFIIILIILKIIIIYIEKILKFTHLSILDKILGSILGFFESLIISIVVLTILLFVQDFNAKVKNDINSSKTAYYISIYTKDVNKLLPKTIRSKLNEFYFKNIKIKLTDDIFDKLKKEIKQNENQN